MASEKYLITGLAKDTGVHPRKDITEFMDPGSKQWNLFLEALKTLHDQDEGDDNPLGYYQIAGIHGAPFINWMEAHEDGDRPMDYCTHGTALFLTWHRPYLLLLEQRIVEEAVKIAYPLDEEYQAEARKIRLPYWDWATNSNVPAAAREPMIEVRLPIKAGGPIITKDIHNPLYSYKFKSTQRIVRDFTPVINAEFFEAFQNPTKPQPRPNSHFTTFMETRRCPELQNPFTSNMAVVDAQLQGAVPPDTSLPTDWRNGIYRLLRCVHDYGNFSNTGWSRGLQTKQHLSLESYHNSIHNYTGTNYGPTRDPNRPLFPTGHMTEVSVAAFDPIFWLHHTNIDRLYAMWQAINYNSKFEEQAASTTRLPAVAEVSTDSGETILRPFYHTQPLDQSHIDPKCVWANFWVQKTGNDKYPGTFEYGYTYPEIGFAPSNDEERERLKEDVIDEVNRLYTPVKLGSTIPGKTLTFPEGTDEIDKQAQYRREWVANIHVKNYLVSNNFVVFVFLGAPPEDPALWVMSPNLAGSLSTFKAPSELCMNCASQKEANAYVSASVDLTHILYNQTTVVGRGQLHEEEKMVEYLRENLCWRLMRVDRKVIDIEPLLKTSPEALEVSVASFYLGYPKALRGDAGAVKPGKGEPKGGLLFGEKTYAEATHRLRHVGGLKET